MPDREQLQHATENVDGTRELATKSRLAENE